MRQVKWYLMSKLVFEAQILSFAQSSVLNPYLKSCTFVLADDRPNENSQGIPYSEFDNLAASAVGMPIKMRFVGKRAGGVANHEGSIPIGHIVSVAGETEGEGDSAVHRLVAEGALYANEYPDAVEYLEEAYAENKAPGISWELSYKDSIVERGVQWLKGVIARAATFVRNPAYGSRTALLAIAQDLSVTDDQIEQIMGILDQPPPTDGTTDIGDIQGGTDKVTLEEALAKIKQLETELEARLADASALNESTSRVAELEKTVADLTATITGYQKATLVADRTSKVVEAGLDLEADAEVLAKRQELWASMSDEVFAEYITGISAMAKKVPAKPAAASIQKPAFMMPKVAVDTAGNVQTSVTDLRSKMRGLGRAADEAE